MPVINALLLGLLFGVGLVFSGMTDPRKVQDFLDVFGQWNPTLAFVMGGALLVTFPAFLIAKRLHKPWLAEAFIWPKATEIDRRLITGAVLFGAGWGIGGLCPGPALVNLGSLDGGVWLFVLAMVAGFWLHDKLLSRF